MQNYKSISEWTSLQIVVLLLNSLIRKIIYVFLNINSIFIAFMKVVLMIGLDLSMYNSNR